jgi:hypothetical protein
VFACAIVVAWATAAHLVCQNCYRIGNFVYYWFQRELVRTDRADDGELVYLNRQLRGIREGVMMRRWLRFEWFTSASPLIEHIYGERAAQVPRGATLRSAATFVRTRNWLLYGENLELLRDLSPSMQTAVHALLDKAPTTASASADSPGTCIVHLRVGDVMYERRRGDLSAAATERQDEAERWWSKSWWRWQPRLTRRRAASSFSSRALARLQPPRPRLRARDAGQPAGAVESGAPERDRRDGSARDRRPRLCEGRPRADADHRRRDVRNRRGHREPRAGANLSDREFNHKMTSPPQSIILFVRDPSQHSENRV